jgi:hypothetical protein
MRRKFTAVLVVLLTSLALALAPPAGAITSSDQTGQAGFGWSAGTGSNGAFDYQGASEWVTIPNNVDHGSCTSGGNYIDPAVWVGLIGMAGYPQFPFTQNGVSIGPGGTVGAWYEQWNPDGSDAGSHGVNLGFTVNPGDQLLIREVWGAGHNTLYMVWTDETTNQSHLETLNGPNQGRFYAAGRGAENVIEDPTFPSGGSPLLWFGRINATNAKAEQNTGYTFGDDGAPRPTSTTPVNDATYKWNMKRNAPNQGSTRVDVFRSGTDNTGWYAVQNSCT